LTIFSHIVCCSDFSDHADRAFLAALDQSRLDGARLTLLHVVAPGTPILPGDSVRQSQRMADEDIVNRLLAYMRERYLSRSRGVQTGISLRRGYPSEEILAHLDSAGTDLVVLGSQGLHGVGLVLLGSVAERVSRRAGCCCLVVR
jgi:nucleotide-binding universal stress UspA family protein